MLPVASLLIGVGHGAPKKALSKVRRTDPRSAQIGGPDGISKVLQVKTYSGEPVEASAPRNLLAKDRWRAALRDEAPHLWPEVALVGGAPAFSGDAERLTGAGAGPDGGIVGDAGESEGESPASDTGEKVDLSVPHKVSCADIGDAPFVNIAGREMAGGDEGAQPGGGEGVVLVVVGAGHGAPTGDRLSR